MSCPSMRGAKQPDGASLALQSLMRDYGAESWIPAADGGAKLYGHYPGGQQYSVAVTGKQIEERARTLATHKKEEAIHYERC